MAKTYTAFGRTITIDDDFVNSIEQTLSIMNNTACHHYLAIHFGKDVENVLPNHTDEELSQIVKEEAKSEALEWR